MRVLLGSMVLVAAFAGCLGSSSVLDAGGTGPGHHEMEITCKEDLQHKATPDVKRGKMTVQLIDATTTMRKGWPRTYTPTSPDENDRLEYPDGKWKLIADRSNDFDGRVKFELKCL